MTTAVLAPATVATLATKTLQQALVVAHPAVMKSGGYFPICKTFYVQAGYGDDGTEPYLKITATNTEMGIRHTVPLATLSAEFAVCVSADRLKQFVDGLAGDVVGLELVDTELIVSAHRAKARLKTSDPEDFPKFPTPGLPVLNCAGKRLALAATLTADFASKDETRPVLHGVNLLSKEGDVKVQAADGFICAMWTGFADPSVEQFEECDLIVPVGLFRELAKVAGASGDKPVSLFASGNGKPTHAYLLADDDGKTTEFACKLLEGDFPDLKRIVPSETPDKGVTIDASPDRILRSLKRVTPFGVVETTGRTVSLVADGVEDLLRIGCADAELGVADDAVDVKVGRTDDQRYFHASGNLQKVFQAIRDADPEAEAHVWMSGPLSSAKITAEALPGYTAVVMPIFVKGQSDTSIR